MGKVQKMMDVFTAEAETFAHEQYKDGEPTGEYDVYRNIDVTLNSEYGDYSSVAVTLDEAKQMVKVLQEVIKKASRSDKQIIAEEKKRSAHVAKILKSIRGRVDQED